MQAQARGAVEQGVALDRSSRPGSRHAVVRYETPQGPVVVKHFGRRRGRLRLALKQIGHWTFAGKTPASAAGRRQTEAECLELWSRHGFDVFRPVAKAELPPIMEPHLVLEFVQGRTACEMLRDPGVAESAKVRLLERFAPEWRRRHATALELDEPRLLHEHGSFRHVFVAGERLITFDFEIAWRRRHVTGRLIGREIASYLRSLGRVSGDRDDRFQARLVRLVRAYGDPAQLRECVRSVRRARNPLERLTFRLERLGDRRDPYCPSCVLDRVAALVGG